MCTDRHLRMGKQPSRMPHSATSLPPLVHSLSPLCASSFSLCCQGAVLYLSSSICSFRLFNLTLIQCILQLILSILLVNCWGWRERTKRRINANTTMAHTEEHDAENLAHPHDHHRHAHPAHSSSHQHRLTSRLSRTGPAAGSRSKLSSLPTLKPFQHPAFPPEAQLQVPLFAAPKINANRTKTEETQQTIEDMTEENISAP